MGRSITVEICVGDLRSALEAGEGGADRLELCDRLEVGGTTPSAGTIAEACWRLAIPVHVLIRPRAGDFAPSEPELAAMRHDVETAKRLGASGVVFGILKNDGTIDRDATARLADLARPMSVTFHKAFDQTPDLDAALETLVELGVDRVLTSGGHSSAEAGADALARLIATAGDRIGVLVAGRLTVENLGAIVARTGAREVHLGSDAVGLIKSPAVFAPHDGSDLDWQGVRAEKVRRIMEASYQYDVI
ncbi:MAG: copper homeostasis protein CutC [Paludisphaera borealis]|uniref:copper homeostasis protein CutC n=1 Tax=Paludisphaera borealis TaxID=1387353 RepID=UPI002848BEDA|nr:copper homeostasis protein CutC [Paludisphaera borealis]MDR3618771.1 copper homeostasis protein CutC [Paludisphaera borealis]